MEWVETTGRTLEEAKELALDQLGVVADEAEFTVLAEPKQGLFGRLRGEARVRARVRPAPVRPKQDRRRGRKSSGAGEASSAPATAAAAASTVTHAAPGSPDDVAADSAASDADAGARGRRRGGRGGRRRDGGTAERGNGDGTPSIDTLEGEPMTTDAGATDRDDAAASASPAPTTSAADVEAVRDAAVTFVGGLTRAFGFEADVAAVVEGSEIEVRVDGASLGLLIGPGGRTLLAIQDLARVAAQRRLGDHDTRLRVDVAGYREKRREALVRFAGTVADQVKETGVARSLDPMPSADRKILHDVLADIEGVTSRSEGEDPYRRVVVAPE
jgi:spoIIIJ-associated protein